MACSRQAQRTGSTDRSLLPPTGGNSGGARRTAAAVLGVIGAAPTRSAATAMGARTARRIVGSFLLVADGPAPDLGLAHVALLTPRAVPEWRKAEARSARPVPGCARRIWHT